MPPGGIALEHVEQQLCELATHLAAATCRFLVLLAHFDRREGWRSWGCRGTAQWLSWRCGMGRGTAREHVRVARALEQLPVTRTEFAGGRLSFSKVRALSRVAVPETEQELVQIAKKGTASHVERIVRGCRRADAADDPKQQRARCFARWRREEDGTITITARLDAPDGELVVAAIKAARRPAAIAG